MRLREDIMDGSSREPQAVAADRFRRRGFRVKLSISLETFLRPSISLEFLK